VEVQDLPKTRLKVQFPCQMRRRCLWPAACGFPGVSCHSAPPHPVPLVVYQHDRSDTFRFVLRGSLAGPAVEDLEHAWTTAQSVMQGKELWLDLCWLLGADPAGVRLLGRMRAAGARIVPPMPPLDAEIQEALGLPEPAAKTPPSGPRQWLTALFHGG
jgi:hypothetical protein